MTEKKERVKDTRSRTTISLQRSTVLRLGELGRFNETYDDVVTRLIEKFGSPGEEDAE